MMYQLCFSEMCSGTSLWLKQHNPYCDENDTGFLISENKIWSYIRLHLWVISICVTELHVVSRTMSCLECVWKLPTQSTGPIWILVFKISVSTYTILLIYPLFFFLTDFIAGVIIGAAFISLESSSPRPQAYGRFQWQWFYWANTMCWCNFLTKSINWNMTIII